MKSTDEYGQGIKVIIQKRKMAVKFSLMNDIMKPLKNCTLSSTKKHMWNPTGKHSGHMNSNIFHKPSDIIVSDYFGMINTLFRK